MAVVVSTDVLDIGADDDDDLDFIESNALTASSSRISFFYNFSHLIEHRISQEFN